MAERNRIVLILGMHRSGTSVIAEALNSSGMSIASKLIPADPRINARGYWEDARVVEINEALFRKLDSSWYDIRPLPDNWWRSSELDSLRVQARAHIRDEYGDTALSLIKDPRLSLLLPFWLQLLAEFDTQVDVIVMNRCPEAVAASLYRRDQLPADYGLCLWLHYQKSLALCLQATRFTTIDYDAVLADPVAQLEKIAEDLALPISPSNMSLDIADQSLRHHLPGTSSRETGKIHELAADIHEKIAAGSAVRGAGESAVKSAAESAIDWNRVSVTEDQSLRQLLFELASGLMVHAGKQVEIGEMHSNAQQLVAQRDRQLKDTQSELARTAGLYDEAVKTSAEKEAASDRIVAEIEQARAVIAERDSRLEAVNRMIEDQGKLLSHAESVIKERDEQLQQAHELRDQLQDQREELDQRLSQLNQRLRGSIIGRLALRLIERKDIEHDKQ